MRGRLPPVDVEGADALPVAGPRAAATAGPETVVAAGDKIPDFTVIYSNGMRRQDKRAVVELRGKGQTRKVDVLKRLIPSQPAKFQ